MPLKGCDTGTIISRASLYRICWFRSFDLEINNVLVVFYWQGTLGTICSNHINFLVFVISSGILDLTLLEKP